MQAVKAHKESSAALDEKKKVHAGLQKERLQLDKALGKRRAELERRVRALCSNCIACISALSWLLKSGWKALAVPKGTRA